MIIWDKSTFIDETFFLYSGRTEKQITAGRWFCFDTVYMPFKQVNIIGCVEFKPTS